MNTPAPTKKVSILLWKAPGGSGSLAILERLREHGVTNAYAFNTSAAINARGEVETNRMAELLPNLPVVIAWSAPGDTVERILPHIRPLVREGLITVEDSTVDFIALDQPRDLPQSMSVAEVMTREVVAVTPESPISEVVADLLTRSFRSLPVVDGNRRVVGIITNGDLVHRGGMPVSLDLLKGLDTPELHEGLAAMTASHREASEVMTRDVVTVRESAGVRHAADLMLQRRLKRLPVVDDAGRLVGIVSRVDLLRSVLPVPLPGAEAAERPPLPPSPAVFGDIMSRDVPVVSPQAPLTEVLNVILATRLHRAVVVDEQRTVLGIVSDLDLMKRLDPEARPGVLEALRAHVPFVHRPDTTERDYRHATGKTARELMHTDVVMANERATVRDVLRSFLESDKKVIPVVDDRRHLVGIVDRADLLRAIARL